MSSIKPNTRYFRIEGGNTVVQHNEDGWARWDFHDGLVSTNIWTADDPRLSEISFEEALEFMK